MKKVLILVDNARRDLLWTTFLEFYFKKYADIHVRLCHKRNVNIALRQFMPDAFVVSRADYPYVKLLQGLCRIYVVPGEGGRLSPASALGPYLGRAYSLERMHDVSFIDRAYVWGYRVAAWLQETGLFQNRQLKVAGNNRLDIYRTYPGKGTADTQPFTIGFAFSAKTTSTYYGYPHFPRFYHDTPEKEHYAVLQNERYFEEFLWKDHAILRIAIEALKRILRDTTAKVSFRVSPFEDVNEYQFLERQYPGRIKIEPQTELLPEWLQKVDVMITCWSTAGLEALILEKPVIALVGMMDQGRLFDGFRPKENGFEDYVPCYYTPQSHDEMMALLKRAQRSELSYSPQPEHFSQFIYDVYGWSSTDQGKSKTAIIVEDIIDNLNAHPLPRSGRREWRNRIPSQIDDLLGRFMPAILASGMAYPVSYMRHLFSDTFSGNFAGNREHYRLRSKAVTKLVDLADL